MKNLKNTNYQHGFSIIELMIALVIGLLLLGGTTSMFISNKQIYKDQNEMARLQENARFAVEMLIKDIRMAGYAGCMDRIGDITNHVNGSGDDDSLLNFGNAVEGSEAAANWLPSNSTDAVASIVAGTDAISIKYLSPTGISIADEMPNVSSELKVTTVGDLQLGDIIALSDCDSADIMQLTQVQDASNHLQHNAGGAYTPGNATKNLSKVYSEDAEILRVVSRRYFVGTSADTGERALFRHTMDYEDFDNDGNRNEIISQEMIEGVENIQILYGVDTAGADTIADTYVNAAAVANWDNVVAVRIALLMQTIEEDFSQDLNTNTYTLLGTNYDPADDRRRRRVFTNTIQIRNRSN